MIEAPSLAAQQPIARPWTVTSAAVIGFVLAALALLAAVCDFAWAAQANTTQHNTVAAGLMSLLFAALLIGAGVSAWRGVTDRGLLKASAAIIVVNMIFIVIVLATGGVMLSVLASVVLVALSAINIALLVQHSSRQFFHGRGATAI